MQRIIATRPVFRIGITGNAFADAGAGQARQQLGRVTGVHLRSSCQPAQMQFAAGLLIQRAQDTKPRVTAADFPKYGLTSIHVVDITTDNVISTAPVAFGAFSHHITDNPLFFMDLP